jgi:glycosyltransferase involved in cell wall biosynthesis
MPVVLFRSTLNRRLRRHAGRRELPPMPDPPRAEIVVPCYNHAPFLPEALDSVVAQTFPEPFGLALVDDCSTDATPQVIERFAAGLDDPRIALRTLRNERNLRQWGSLNGAIASSEADLIMVLNDDDLLLPDALAKAVEVFESHPEVAIFGAHSLWLEPGAPRPDRPEQPLRELRTLRSTPKDAKRFSVLEDLRMTQSSCTFRRAAWEAVGGYSAKDDRIHPDANEDRDFQMRVAINFPTLTVPDYALAIWRTDSSHGQQF